jgi:hypothetical protein
MKVDKQACRTNLTRVKRSSCRPSWYILCRKKLAKKGVKEGRGQVGEVTEGRGHGRKNKEDQERKVTEGRGQGRKEGRKE